MKKLKQLIESAKKIKGRSVLELWSYILLLMIGFAFVIMVIHFVKVI